MGVSTLRTVGMERMGLWEGGEASNLSYSEVDEAIAVTLRYIQEVRDSETGFSKLVDDMQSKFLHMGITVIPENDELRSYKHQVFEPFLAGVIENLQERFQADSMGILSMARVFLAQRFEDTEGYGINEIKVRSLNLSWGRISHIKYQLRCNSVLTSGSTVIRTDDSPAEPCSVLRFRRGGFTPISDDADKIYAANHMSIEHSTIQLISENYRPRHKQQQELYSNNGTAECMSDRSGIIHRTSVRLSVTDQVTSHVNFTPTDSTKQQAEVLQTGPDSSEQPANQSSHEHQPPNERWDKNLPTDEQLELMKENITTHMPEFFRKVHRYDMYSADILFENNYWGQNKLSRGIKAYAWELAKLKMKGNFAFCGINLYIMNITSHPEDGTIKVRWTMRGIPQLQGLMFWKWNLFNLKGKGGVKETMRETFRTYDGFNTFWLNRDGAIVRHRLDKVVPDDSMKVSDPVKKISNLLGAKINPTSSTSSTKYSQLTHDPQAILPPHK